MKPKSLSAISGTPRLTKIKGGARRGAGRKPVPQMPCGWGCGALLSGDELRGHWKTCPKRGA